MANIISLESRIENARKKHEEKIRKRKLAAVHNVFQGARQKLRCDKCQRSLPQGPDPTEKTDRSGGPGTPEKNLRVPYLFCESCSLDYIDYIERLQGRGDPDCYWHNDTWMRAWRRWIDYQGAVDEYKRTYEFRQLIKELAQTGATQEEE